MLKGGVVNTVTLSAEQPVGIILCGKQPRQTGDFQSHCSSQWPWCVRKQTISLLSPPAISLWLSSLCLAVFVLLCSAPTHGNTHIHLQFDESVRMFNWLSFHDFSNKPPPSHYMTFFVFAFISSLLWMDPKQSNFRVMMTKTSLSRYHLHSSEDIWTYTLSTLATLWKQHVSTAAVAAVLRHLVFSHSTAVQSK